MLNPADSRLKTNQEKLKTKKEKEEKELVRHMYVQAYAILLMLL